MKMNSKYTTLCVAFGGWVFLVATLSSHASTITKDNNTIDLTNALSWVGGIVPSSTDVALWDSTVTGANTINLGANTSWLGIKVLNPGGLITVTGTNTLFLGSSGMDLSTASADLTLASSSVSCSANQSWNIATGRTLTLTGWLNLYGAITVGSGASGSAGTLNLNGSILNLASTSASMSVGSYGVINANGVSVTNSSTGSVTLSAPMTLGPEGLNLVKQVVTHNLTLSSRLSGVGGFVSALGGTCNTYVTGNNTFTGPITISSGYFHNSGTYAVPVGCNLTNNGAWGMDKSVTLGSFAGSGSIFRDSSQGAAVLTVGYNNADGNYSGSIGEGTSSQLSLTKIGTGKFTISGTCSYTGTTTASNGTLLVDGVLRASPVEVRSGAALGGGGIISNNVTFANGAKALFTDTGTLTIVGSVTGSGNIIHLNLSSNVTAGYYLLATCGSGAGSAFSPVPVVDNGSFAPGTTNYFITILSGSQVWLVVQNQNPPEVMSGQFAWPTSQFLPNFQTNASLIDCIDISGIGGPLSDLYTSLQGIVNRAQPRIACVASSAEEGKFTWLTNHIQNYRMNSGYNLICKYSSLLSGLVVHDTNLADTLNLATTIAGITNGLICDPSLLNLLTNAPFNLPVVVDLRGKFTDKYQVYGYLYSNYWSQCTHRIITGLQTNTHGCLRDYVVAVKSACVWLDPGSVTADATALAPFMSSMTPVGGVWMGWVPNENNDVPWFAQYGIPVLASDYYLNGSLYSGVRSDINVPAIPSLPTLKNKIYVCFFLSDGDNIAYMQHKMRAVWKDSARGSVPIGWTTSALACDIDPGMLNYYWSSATTNDCLVSGPSGAGYAKIEHWSAAYANAFTAASSPYLKKAGHRVVTVWDSVSTANGKYYGTNCPTLAGLTDQGSYYTTTAKGKIPVMGMPSGYASTTSNLLYGITNAAARWAASGPMFIPVQGSGWDITPSELLTVASSLNSNYVVVRPDTLFLLYKQYHGQGAVLDPAPSNLKAIRRYNGAITLAWTGSDDASSYKVARSTSSGTETIIGSSITTSYTDIGLADDQTYYYVVSTENLAGLSGNSSEVTVLPLSQNTSSYSSAVIAANPLAYWPLNETSGTVAYDLVGNHDGTYKGGFTLAQPGIANGGFGFPGSYAASFDGSSGYVTIPQGPFNSTNALTVMAWVKVTNTPSHFSGLVGQGDNSWRLSVDTLGKPRGNNAHVYGDVTGPTSIVSTNWHMIAYTYTGVPNVTNNGVLYVDGFAKGTNTVGELPGSSTDVWIGGAPDYGTARLLSGSIAQVAVFTNALSAAQIQAFYQTGTNTTPMIDLFPLSAKTGMQVVWSQGKLLQSTNICGPWTTNTQSSPCTVVLTNSQMFFRVQ